MARIHGGDLTVTSAPGEGSECVLTLPLAPDRFLGLGKPLAARYLESVRAADCDTPGCTDRMVGVDDEELLRSIRKHVDAVHPEDRYTDEQLRDWMGTAVYTIAKPHS